MTSYDVAVIGYGPVGATLANLLALRGLRVVVVEQETEIYPLPRAIQFDGEAMRLFQTIGIAAELEPDLRVAARMHFIDAEGHTLIDWWRPTDIKPQGWNTSYRFHQPTLEAALRRRLAGLPNATVLLGHELTGLADGAEGVALGVTDRATGEQAELSASYVVGADGARSLVRRIMGTTLDDLESHERWLVVDCLLKDGATPDLDEESVQYCDPRRPATYVPGPHNRRRWELMLHEHEDAAEMVRPERVWEMLEPWLTPAEATIERPAVYTFHSVVARGWAKGRVFLAGDACHQTPPFMGQGMCAGVRDAANLAWKLVEVVQGRADADLLDTYESERSPHVRTFIETAVRLGSVISTTDVDVARERDLRMRANPEGFTTPAPRLGAGAWDADDERAGHIGEQPFMADGTHADDLVGYDWAVIATPDAAARLAGTVAPRVVAVDSESGRDWLGRLAAEAVLVRPDRYVAAAADSVEALDDFAVAVRRLTNTRGGQPYGRMTAMALDWTFHPAGDATAPTVLVVPGGGYHHLAAHEGAPVAGWLNELGLHAAVLHYAVGYHVWPRPLHDARAALRALRSGDVPLPVDRRRVGVLGFSAGGHLAALLATDSPDVPGADPLTFAGRPDVALLAYPVTDLRETMFGRLPNLHTDSADNLLGEGAPEEVRAALSVATRVTPPEEEELPDLFLWTTSDDATVPALHALSLMTSLAVAGVPFEGHVFRSGRHGLGLADEEPEVAQWTDLAERWLADRGWC